MYLFSNLVGDESYENQALYAQDIFDELTEINTNGYLIHGIRHDMKSIMLLWLESWCIIAGYKNRHISCYVIWH